jgi:uncharacterized membrane protein SirB2
MKENIISFLKDDTNISSFWVYFVAGSIVILILKSLLKSTKIKPKVFDTLILLASIVFLILAVCNVVITENYHRLWNMIFALVVIIVLNVFPKFLKWYDNKIDKLVKKP